MQEEQKKKTLALETWVDSHSSLLAADRIHMSPTKKIIAKSKGQHIQPGYGRLNGKPFGFWYAIGLDWMNFLTTEFQSNIYDFIFKVDINPSKMIFIENQQQIVKFNDTYCPNAHLSKSWGPDYKILNKNTESQCNVPDWAKVAKEHHGMELNLILKKFILNGLKNGQLILAASGINKQLNQFL